VSWRVGELANWRAGEWKSSEMEKRRMKSEKLFPNGQWLLANP